MQDCKKFMKMAGTTLINQNALIMATSDDRGCDLEKYKKKVIADMEKSEADTESQKCNSLKEKSKSFEELMFGTLNYGYSIEFKLRTLKLTYL